MRRPRRVSRYLAAMLMAVCAVQQGLADDQKSPDKKKDPAEIGNRNVGRGVNFYSIPQEIALGKKLAAAYAREVKLVTDPVVTEYVNRVGQNLVRNSDAKVPFTIQVVDSDVVNATALPGGFFFVNSGVLLQAENEAELAGAMAHEIAHVAARHGTRQATRAQIAQTATIPLIFMGGWPGFGVSQGANVLMPAVLLQFSRAFESEADLLGLEYMYKTGYDPSALVDFFERLETLERRKPGALSKVFATHPLTGDRMKAAQKNIRDYLKPRPDYVVTTSEFNDVKARMYALHDGRKLDPKDPNRPRLQRNPGQAEPGQDEDGRPSLKRRLAD